MVVMLGFSCSEVWLVVLICDGLSLCDVVEIFGWMLEIICSILKQIFVWLGVGGQGDVIWQMLGSVLWLVLLMD